MMTVPVAADEALNVQVDVGAVAFNAVGEQAVVAPVGEVAVRPTVPVNPPRGTMVIVEAAVPPTGKDTDVGLAARLKSGCGGGGAVTVTLVVVGVVVAPSGEPVNWTVTRPEGVEEETEMGRLLVAPAEVGVTGLTVNDPQETPDGRGATHDSVTGETVPEVRVAVMVTVAELPD
jgi:hypothetical protein